MGYDGGGAFFCLFVFSRPRPGKKKLCFRGFPIQNGTKRKGIPIDYWKTMDWWRQTSIENLYLLMSIGRSELENKYRPNLGRRPPGPHFL